MSDPTNNFSFDLDPYDRLAQMLDGGLFKLLPLPPSWAKYVRDAYAVTAPAPAIPGFRKLPDLMKAQAPVDPGPPSFDPLPITPLGASTTPGFDKSLPILEALAAADPRPAGFYRSPMFTGAGTTARGFDPNLPSTIGPQAMLFGGPGLPPASPPPSTGLDLTPVSFPPPLSRPATGFSPLGAQPSPATPVNSPPTEVPNATPAPATEPEPSSTVGRLGVAPPVEPPSNSLELEQEFQKWPGQEVRLPNGSFVPDRYSPNGRLMSPFSDLNDVADAGRHLQFFSHLFDEGYDKAKEYAKNYMLGYIGHGGTFDYQRRAYAFGKDGFTQLPQFRDVSNFNVGLIFQQAGIPLEVTLDQAGEYARKHSSNYAPDKPYGIEPRTREFIELGYRVGASHVYDSRRRP